MKSIGPLQLLIVTLLIAVVAPSGAQAATVSHQHHADPPSTHGMLVVGTQAVYLSHLPMFHSPHDYQVILEAKFDDRAQRAYLESLKNHPEATVYTLVPERFSLPEMIKSPRPFKAELFRGHFERGGEPIATNVTVTIKSTIHFRKFDTTAGQPELSSQILFGKSNEWFMAHFITAAPDFDQVTRVLPLKASAFESSSIVELVSQSNSEPLNDGQKIETTTPAGKSSFQIEKSIYLEHSDLAQ